MSRPSNGGGTFMSLFQAFKEECKRYAKQKRLPVSNKSKIYSMTQNEANAELLTPDTFASLIQEIDTVICGADGNCHM
ncbi:hypothetical protein GCK32_022087 [Trichostrongylus colubriformis]|uniref:Uncharacterized protein n=1 Tax=Trichostrongylus colubriformis TaxID=6319 RepID=A0AAN8FKP8_TRICO